MITITDKKKCSGCKACQNACVTKAISFEEDKDGFWYPFVNIEKCTQCGLCERVCPYKRDDYGIPDDNKVYTQIFFAAQVKEHYILKRVSSGGAFQALAKVIIEKGGTVYGAVQENVDHIFHIRITTESELKRTRKSKYFQSDTNNSYSLVKKDLIDGRPVLFSGTGCQIAGLYCYLGKEYANLYTCEVVCHGVPSRKIWECYRNEKEEREGKKIVGLVFRDKSKGWSRNQYKITYDDGTVEYERSTYQLFHAGYLQGFFYRPSCGSCPFANLPRVADVTLGDFWNYKGELNKKDLGVSLVAINNVNGLQLLKEAENYLFIEKTSKEDALESCRHINHHPEENPQKEEFIKKVFSNGYYVAANKYIVISKSKTGIINRLKLFLRR